MQCSVWTVYKIARCLRSHNRNRSTQERKQSNLLHLAHSKTRHTHTNTFHKMYSDRVVVSMAMVAAATLLVVCMTATPSVAQSGISAQNGFGASRPAASVIFEPTLSFIRQNLRLINSYVALFRSVFVGAYERPLITSTDRPTTGTSSPHTRVPAIDLPDRRVSTPRH